MPASGQIRVVRLVPIVEAGELRARLQVENLFSKKITGTIQSGLPCIVEIEIVLQENGKKIVQKTDFKRILYNLWEEKYEIRTEDTTVVFSELQQVIRQCSDSAVVRLSDHSLLQPNSTYVLKVRVSIAPISNIQSQKLENWLREPNYTESDITSEEQTSGFKLNISQLVSFFIGGGKRRENVSPWFEVRFKTADIMP